MSKKKIFFISDIHGCYDEMIEALNKAKYDSCNDKHLLVVLGDIFDRGDNNIKVYEYLKKLTNERRAIVTSGNHHKFLIDFLEGSTSPFNYINNGLDNTLGDFLHRTRPFESWCWIDKDYECTNESYSEWCECARKKIMEEYPDLLPWLKSFPRYFESKHYIGVHGAIDTKVKDWHNPNCSRCDLKDWDALDFDDGSFFKKDIKNIDKTIVIGHYGTRFLRKMYPTLYKKFRQIEKLDDILVRRDGRVIAIDSTVIASHYMNVYVVEDEVDK